MFEENSFQSNDINFQLSLFDELMLSLDWIKHNAIKASVKFYDNKFDKIFNDLVDCDEMREKLAKLKDNHMKQYSIVVDKQLTEQLELFIKSEQIVEKLKLIESNDLMDNDSKNIRQLVVPIKNDYLNELREIELKLNDEYVDKMNEYETIKKCFDERYQKYTQIRKLLYKKIVSLTNQLEDIDIEALDSLEV